MIKNEQIVYAMPGLMYLKDAKLPNATAFQLLRFLRLYNPALEDYGKAERKLLEEFAEKDDTGAVKFEGGNPLFETEEKMKAFDKCLQELRAQDSQLKNFKKFTFASLGNVEISAGHLMGMEWLFEEEDTSK